MSGHAGVIGLDDNVLLADGSLIDSFRESECCDQAVRTHVHNVLRVLIQHREIGSRQHDEACCNSNQQQGWYRKLDDQLEIVEALHGGTSWDSNTDPSTAQSAQAVSLPHSRFNEPFP
ncbi:hypothetical protein [Methylobacterium sp. CM6257]